MVHHASKCTCTTCPGSHSDRLLASGICRTLQYNSAARRQACSSPRQLPVEVRRQPEYCQPRRFEVRRGCGVSARRPLTQSSGQPSTAGGRPRPGPLAGAGPTGSRSERRGCHCVKRLARCGGGAGPPAGRGRAPARARSRLERSRSFRARAGAADGAEVAARPRAGRRVAGSLAY
jgi:hypothetical protein